MDCIFIGLNTTEDTHAKDASIKCYPLRKLERSEKRMKSQWNLAKPEPLKCGHCVITEA